MAVQPTIAAAGLEDVADEMRAALRRRIADAPGWKLARVAFVVRPDGVESVERSELASWYRRHGLYPLARQVSAAPLGRALVVIEADEVAVLAVDPAWARLPEVPR